jgi:sulfate adenylyltransferase
MSPHGGKLVERALGGASAERARSEAPGLAALSLDAETAQELRNIAAGVFSPLEGPVGEADLGSIIQCGRLSDGTAFTIPILLDVDERTAEGLTEGRDVALYEAEEGDRSEGAFAGVLHLEQVYEYDKATLARAVFGTDDPSHPGVAGTFARGDLLLAGPVDMVPRTASRYGAYDLTPAQTRELFAERGWRTTGAFQTRNVPHVGHEDLQKTVLGLVDGLLIHPIVGRKKPGDFRDSVILKAYQVLLEHYFPRDRVVLSVLDTPMRYAGPKEAIFHAIVRKNFGCTHIIIGRDHAGVGSFYGEEAAIEIFAQFPELGIQPITIRGDFFYCRVCDRIASERTCPHNSADHIAFSGTEIRAMLRAGRQPPRQIMRPEVFRVLAEAESPFVA